MPADIIRNRLEPHIQKEEERDHVQDTRTSRAKEDEEPDVEEDGDDRATQLCDELVPRLRTEEVSGLQVAYHNPQYTVLTLAALREPERDAKLTCHVGRLRRGSRSDDTCRQVHRLRWAKREVRALSDTTEDELRRLRDRSDGVDVGRAGRLDADKRERESEDEREERLADVHVE